MEHMVVCYKAVSTARGSLSQDGACCGCSRLVAVDLSNIMMLYNIDTLSGQDMSPESKLQCKDVWNVKWAEVCPDHRSTCKHSRFTTDQSHNDWRRGYQSPLKMTPQDGGHFIAIFSHKWQSIVGYLFIYLPPVTVHELILLAAMFQYSVYQYPWFIGHAVQSCGPYSVNCFSMELHFVKLVLIFLKSCLCTVPEEMDHYKNVTLRITVQVISDLLSQ